MHSQKPKKTLFVLVSEFFENLATVFLIILCIIVFIEVVARFVLKVPTPWSEELARYILIELVFLGTALSLRRRGHLVVANVFDRAPKFLRLINATFIYAVVVGLSVFLFVCAVRMIGIVSTETATSMLWLKTSYLYYLIAFSLGLNVVYAAVDYAVALGEIKA